MKQSSAQQKYDFFVSGKWRNRDNVIRLTKNIRKKGYKVYCFLETEDNTQRISNNPEEEMQKFEKLNWRSDPYVKKVFENDMTGERNSSTFVLLLPAGKSCHIEAGVAYGMRKKCILIGEQKEAESLYLIFEEIYQSENDFLQTL